MRVWSSGLSCASPGGPVWWRRRGSTRQPESPNVHISGSRPSKTPPKFNERTPRVEEKNKFCGGKGKKKSEILGGPGEGRSGGGGSGGDSQKILNTPTSTNRHQQATTNNNQEQQTTTTENLAKTLKHQNAKCGLAKCCQHFETLILAKCGFGQMWFGQKQS